MTNMNCAVLMSSPAVVVLSQVMPTWDGNKLVLKYEPKEAESAGKPQTHTRELDGEELILVCLCCTLYTIIRLAVIQTRTELVYTM